MKGHQGDVWFRKVDGLPSGEMKQVEIDKERNSVVLAYGEVTGHSHRIAETENAVLWEVSLGLEGNQEKIERYLEVKNATVSLIHEEHFPVSLEEGFYKIWIQREYTPEEIRNVAD